MSILSGSLRTLSAEAYIYLYPLVTMEVTRRQFEAGDSRANAFLHLRVFPAADFRAVVRPNFDTLYSSAWIDLRGGPVVVEVPDSDGRYYLLPMLDQWTDVFACPGARTTGTGPQRYVLVPPGHTGEVPDGERIDAPTPHVWIIGRTQTNGVADYPAVNAFQDGMRLLGPDALPAADPGPGDIDDATEPLHYVNALAARDFFALAADALATAPPHPTDTDVLARIARLGIVPGEPFDPSGIDVAGWQEIDAGAADGLSRVRASIGASGRRANGWLLLTETMGVYGNSYLRRAGIAFVGLGANPAEDAVYPLLLSDADGAAPTGDRSYVIHFDAGALPPVDAFWSITMYDADGFQAANAIDRFAIGDRDELRFAPDGSLDILVQHDDPGGDATANWLPSPLGPLGITMRLYAPKPEVLTGAWAPPPMRRA